jgi:uncharacterized protein YecE (DUF72 family)
MAATVRRADVEPGVLAGPPAWAGPPYWGCMGVHIGTAGWSYDHWQGTLYPQETPVHARLDHYTPVFRTVELNSSFYRWPRPSTWSSWRRRVPAGFAFSIKAPRALTHGARLYAPEPWLARIGADLVRLGEALGVLLVQLPPDFGYDPARLRYFLGLRPAWLRVALEFRHPSWQREDTFALLAEHGAAYCVMSGAHLPCVLRATTSFVYARLHGPDPNSLYAGSYSDADLRWWADRVREWAAQERDVFVYFNNDGNGHAVRNAATLGALLGV